MIQIIKHRCNNIADLEFCKTNWGVEIDIRSDMTQFESLYLTHDPYVRGPSFDDWIVLFKSKGIAGPLILNTKEDGLESVILKKLKLYDITNYIFLDTSLPTLNLWTRNYNNHNFFIRHSSIEPIEFVQKHLNFCKWVWLDCFERKIPNIEDIALLKKNFKICLVSPELQGGSSMDIDNFVNLYKHGIDAVCTKFPEIWEAKTLQK